MPRRYWVGYCHYRVPAALLALSAAGTLARLFALGRRAAHWDEARVGFWTLEYARTGAWSYHPILHGPFLFHANRRVFDLVGPGDASARLVVALVGGLLPLAAWLFRERLSGREVVALGAVLAASPLLVYYSRFARNDLPLAAFALAGLGLAVRAGDTGRARYAIAAGAALGLAFTTKENAVLYLLAWAGAAALVALSRRDALSRADAALRRGRPAALRSARTHLPGVIRGVARHARGWLGAWGGAAIAAGLVWLAVIVVAYAPRAGGTAGVGIGRAIAEPALLPAVVRAATVVPAREAAGLWLLGGHQSPLAAPLYFLHLTAILFVGAAATSLLSVAGTLRELRGFRRPLVLFSAAWAGLSLLGYPLATDFAAPWIAVHVAVPLAVPAAVGLAALSRAASPAGGRSRLAALALVSVAVYALVAGGATGYAYPDHPLNPLGQPAQASADLRGTARDAAACEPARVLYYGDYFRPGTVPRRLPLAWYFEAAGVERRFARGPADLPAEPPPVVVALDTERDVLDPRLPGYRATEHELDPWVAREPYAPFTETVVYLDRRACPPADGEPE